MTSATDRAKARRPQVAPVPPGVARPTWSVMVPTCDDGDLLVQSLGSVLAQDPGPEHMQIEVIDDASAHTDVREIVRGLAGGRVTVTVHERRWGAAPTFTHCAQRSTGRWVHILHADDWVLPGFYAAYESHLRSHPADVAVARSWFVDGDGERLGLSGELRAVDGYLADAERAIALDNPVNFAAVVVARSAYEAHGGFDPGLPHANDWEMWTRLAHHGAIAVVDGAHACYRRHAGSDTTRLQGSMTYLTDPVAALAIISERIDDTRVRAEVQRHVRRRFAAGALEVGAAQAAGGHHRLAATSALWATRLDPRPETARAAADLAAAATRNRLGWSVSAGR